MSNDFNSITSLDEAAKHIFDAWNPGTVYSSELRRDSGDFDLHPEQVHRVLIFVIHLLETDFYHYRREAKQSATDDPRYVRLQKRHGQILESGHTALNSEGGAMTVHYDFADRGKERR